MNTAFQSERLGQGWRLDPGTWSSGQLDVPIAFQTSTELALIADAPGTVRIGLPDFAFEDLGEPNGKQNSFLLVSPALYGLPPESATGAGGAIPVPDDLDAFLESATHVEVVDSGTERTQRGEAPWWEIVSAGNPEVLFVCGYGEGCGGIHIDRSQTLQETPSGERYRMRVYQVPIEDGDLHLVVEGETNRFDEVLEVALEVLRTLRFHGIAPPDPGELNQFAALVGSTQITAGQWFTTISDNDVRAAPPTSIDGVRVLSSNDSDLIINGGPRQTLFLKSRIDFVRPEFTGIEGGLFPTSDMVTKEPPGGTDAWLQSIPWIEIQTTSSESIAGHTGTGYDIIVPDGFGFDELVICGSGGILCVTLFRTRNSSIAADENSITRLIDLPDLNMIAVIQAPIGELNGWVERLDPLLSTLEITPLSWPIAARRDVLGSGHSQRHQPSTHGRARARVTAVTGC